MSDHSHEHAKHGRVHKGESRNWQPHKDWRAWLVVILMVAAVVMYVFSLDDSIVPR
jgi:hypothetical protein